MGVDSNFFRVFTCDLIQGSTLTALQKPQSAVINENTAIRFFGSAQNAMGRHILVNGFNDCVIDGVCKDWTAKSHFPFTILVSNLSFNLNGLNYYDFTTYTYLVLNENASAKALESKLPFIVTKYVAPTIEKGFGQSFEQFSKEGNGYRYFLQPIQKIHLESNLQDELSPTTNITTIYLAAAIALFILVLACMNFVNLSTAISVERAREIGIRKTFGSSKRSIIWQFLCESILTSLISIMLGIMIAKLALPLLNSIVGGELAFGSYFSGMAITLIFVFSVLIGIVAGLYPALVLSSFRPIAVLKGRFKSGSSGLALRNGLVVFQFSVSAILVICTIVINSQMQFMQGSQLGFAKDNVIAIEGTYALQNNRQAFMNEVSKIRGVTAWSFCSDLPEGKSYASCAFQTVETKVQRTNRTTFVDENFQKLFDLQLVSGRFFAKEFGTDSLSLVLNEAAVKDFGLKNPIGSRITSTEVYFNPPDGKGQTIYTVIGVVKDFHFESLHQRIAPLVLTNANKFGGATAAIRIQSGQIKKAIASIDIKWTQFGAKDDFKYVFLDDVIAEQYQAEERARKIFTAFSLLAIFIACMGLFGLVMYSTYQRTKEISIRKVLGASVGNIIFILTKSYVKLITISALTAFPIALWAMFSWLQNFAYRVDINWYVFVIAFVLLIAITFITVSIQALKAAIANPVKNLKIE